MLLNIIHCTELCYTFIKLAELYIYLYQCLHKHVINMSHCDFIVSYDISWWLGLFLPYNLMGVLHTCPSPSSTKTMFCSPWQCMFDIDELWKSLMWLSLSHLHNSCKAINRHLKESQGNILENNILLVRFKSPSQRGVNGF